MAHTTSRGIWTGLGGMLGLYCKQTKSCPIIHINKQEISTALKNSRKCKKDLVALMNASCMSDINICNSTGFQCSLLSKALDGGYMFDNQGLISREHSQTGN